jgi:hypothetical protein
MARRALVLFAKAANRAEGLAAVEGAFDVSTPTARNLVSYGNFLARQDALRRQGSGA